MSISSDGYEVVEVLGAGLDSILRAAEDHANAAAMPREVICSNLRYFQSMIGMDLHIQSKPYLRVVRPGIAADNIGLHRDTWYGDSAYEVSVWIPLTDTDEGSALRVAPGSHLWPESKYPIEPVATDVVQGSEDHAKGFPYAPKRFVGDIATKPIPMRVGQILIFPVSLLHGTVENKSDKVRVSVDCRVANSLAPIRMSRSRDAEYYKPLCVSPITELAKRYEAAQ